uniref:Methyltransferase n=1 Tax=Tetraselmis sp. GSL018 TaxID=582737 RepID=A0A061S3D5_9CHLO|mmetsp:Transcript_890/g.2131  ORF Transcript_890/g.2131 Transcript_890/m.2131 type:complete len:340 (+) Transcript_890:168-1187(+)
MVGDSYVPSNIGGKLDSKQVGSAVAGYTNYHRDDSGSEIERKGNYADMVNKYYDLATSFYEYGWGECFHFAHRWKGETLNESIKRHEHYLALKLGLRPGSKVIDVGCGIGGPLREIARFSGAHVTGLNNNDYQISRGEILNKKLGLSQTCDYVKADFMKIPVDADSFDAAYAIEATCHAPDAAGCYREIFRTLKPGGLFAGYEWCMTDAFDKDRSEHLKCKKGIEIGNGLPDIRTCKEVEAALKDAGFELLESQDLTKTAEVPWYEPLDPSRLSLSSFRTTAIGRAVTRNMVWALEKVGIAPKGSSEVSSFLETGADALVEGGKKELFTPMFFFLARKP